MHTYNCHNKYRNNSRKHFKRCHIYLYVCNVRTEIFSSRCDDITLMFFLLINESGSYLESYIGFARLKVSPSTRN